MTEQVILEIDDFRALYGELEKRTGEEEIAECWPALQVWTLLTHNPTKRRWLVNGILHERDFRPNAKATIDCFYLSKRAFDMNSPWRTLWVDFDPVSV